MKIGKEPLTRINLQKLGTLLITTSFILSVLYPFFHQKIVGFFEIYLSSDQNITPNGQRELTSTFYFGMVLLFGIGYFLFKAQNEYWCNNIRHVFLDEPLCQCTPMQPSPRFILIASSITGFILILMMRLANRFPSIYPYLYKKDYGVIDLCVPTTIAISAVLLLVVEWKFWKAHKFLQYRASLTIVYSLLAFLFLFYSGEEISWGQDFFRWQTPIIFSGNVENQTNFHNYFNAYFDYGYISLSLIPVFVLVSAELEFKNRWIPFNRIFLPHPSLIGLSLLIAFVSIVWFREQELLEELIAAFILFYSLRFFTCFGSENLSLET